MRREFLALTILAAALSLGGGAAEQDADDTSLPEDSSDPEVKSGTKQLTLTEADADKTNVLPKLADVTIALDVKNPIYTWTVIKVDRALGTPTQKKTASGTSFLFKTSENPFMSAGTYSVTLSYKNPKEKISPGMKDVTFKIQVK
jgi:hypothetical protein